MLLSQTHFLWAFRTAMGPLAIGPISLPLGPRDQPLHAALVVASTYSYISFLFFLFVHPVKNIVLKKIDPLRLLRRLVPRLWTLQ